MAYGDTKKDTDSCRAVEAARRELLQSLNEEQTRLFETFCAALEHDHLSTSEDAFYEGFHIGGKLMAEMWKAGS